MAIKITSDSTCDLTKELLEKHDIELFPLYITLGGKTLRDGVEITPDDIFAHVAAGGALASTAAVTPNDYETRFAQLSREYDAVIHINISSDFSACHQNARIAAENYKNVYVVDSRNLSSGHGHVVVEAALRAEAGMKAEDIVKELETDIVPNVDASFILDRLDYMAKGGRCSTVTMLGANVLQLKPSHEYVIEIKRTIPDHKTGIQLILESIVQENYGVIASLEEIECIGHRVVHGGERFKESVVINDEVLKTISSCITIAPLHNPVNLEGIKICQDLFPGVMQVAVFDTAFHQTIPETAYLYGLPY